MIALGNICSTTIWILRSSLAARTKLACRALIPRLFPYQRTSTLLEYLIHGCGGVICLELIITSMDKEKSKVHKLSLKGKLEVPMLKTMDVEQM